MTTDNRRLCGFVLWFLAGLGLLLGLSACGESAITTPTPTHRPSAASDVSQVTLTTDSSIGEVGMVWEVGHLGKATASVEEKVYMSDVVVRARLQSVSDGVLTFRNARYLKGEGSRRFTVRANTENRDSQWDNQDALLFLTKLSGESEDFEFTDTTAVNYGTPDMLKPERYTGDLPEGYTLGTRNPVWLPVQPSSNTGTDSVQRNTASNDDATVITDGARGEHESITQSEIQGLIQWTSGPYTAEKAPTSLVSGQELTETETALEAGLSTTTMIQ